MNEVYHMVFTISSLSSPMQSYVTITFPQNKSFIKNPLAFIVSYLQTEWYYKVKGLFHTIEARLRLYRSENDPETF